MNFIFQQGYKSIKHLPIQSLPDFTIITGANGSGKTHFLEAVANSYIKVDDINIRKIKYYNWSQMTNPDEHPTQPRSIEENISNICGEIARFCEVLEKWIIHQIVSFPNTSNSPYKINVDGVDRNVLLKAYNNKDQFVGDQIQTRTQLISFFVHRSMNQINSQIDSYSGHINIGFDDAITRAYVSAALGLNSGAVMRYISKKANKPFFALSLDDCYKHYPLSSTEQDPFVGSLRELFASYIITRTKNALNKTLAIEYNTPVTYMSQGEFLEHYGPAPWDVFNDVLKEAKLTFRFSEPSPDPSIPLRIKLYHTLSKTEINFSDLSSGERVLVSLAHFLFFSQDSRQPTAMPELILLDEVDAPLHPSMTIDLLRTITNVIVSKYNRKVILATHSPSTVALAPEQSIYVMDVDTKLLRKATRDEGVKALTVGVPVLSIDIANRRQVFVESSHDVNFYEKIAEIARPHIRPDVSLHFMAAGHEKNGGCALLTSLVEQLNRAGNKAVFGIVDWDGERIAEGNLKILGYETRHSIENYILDPVLIGALLLREKSSTLTNAAQSGLPLLEGRENYFSLRDFNQDRLQRIVDAVINVLQFPSNDLVQVKYINNSIVKVPKAYLIMRGHDLESLVQSKFSELKRFHQEPKLKNEILDKILLDIPELLPADFVELLSSIQNH